MRGKDLLTWVMSRYQVNIAAFRQIGITQGQGWPQSMRGSDPDVRFAPETGRSPVTLVTDRL